MIFFWVLRLQCHPTSIAITFCSSSAERNLSRCVNPPVAAFPEAGVGYFKIALEDGQCTGAGQETESNQELKLALPAKNKQLSSFELQRKYWA